MEEGEGEGAGAAFSKPEKADLRLSESAPRRRKVRIGSSMCACIIALHRSARCLFGYSLLLSFAPFYSDDEFEPVGVKSVRGPQGWTPERRKQGRRAPSSGRLPFHSGAAAQTIFGLRCPLNRTI